MDSSLFRDFLLMAYDLDMINGEYVFVYLDIFRLMRWFTTRLFSSYWTSVSLLFPSFLRKDMSLISWYRNDSSEVENRKARRAFETVLMLAVKEPDTERYRHFSAQVNALQDSTMPAGSTSMGKLVGWLIDGSFDAFHTDLPLQG
jgi:hypothetical protein